jgi:phosphoglucosamine mutase
MLTFGTDGMRGEANTDLTAEVAVMLGRASAIESRESEWLLGWDTRISSELLAAAFCAGVASAGKNIHALGEVPTAAIAYSSRLHGMSGAMITASHNPYKDNGIKIFGRDGVKLRKDEETRIENSMLSGTGPAVSSLTGRISWTGEEDFRGEYQRWLVERAQRIDASSLNIAVDGANGAAYKIGPAALRATRAGVTPVACEPNGRNINEGCGSTDLTKSRGTDLPKLSNEVVMRGLDFGLAFDGDADRLLAVDARGELVDGDEIIAIIALHRAKYGRLVKNGVVVTEWSNSGLLRSLRESGVDVEVCPVGDKAVAEAMDGTGFTLGGEQSGHIIMKDFLQVGDGVSTAIELVDIVADSGLPLREVARSAMRKIPQRTTNVEVATAPALIVKDLEPERIAIDQALGEGGRLVLRASGTEGVVRVMVEAEDWDALDRAEHSAQDLLKPYAR